MLNKQQLLNLTMSALFLLPIAPVISQPLSEGLSTEVLFIPPPEDEKPKETRGAGSRNKPCSQDIAVTDNSNTPLTQQVLIPIVPSANWGLTTAKRPRFWIHLPKTSAQQISLSVTEEGKIHHSQAFIPITGKSGLIGVQPAKDLEIGKNYQWAVVLVCGDKATPDDPSINSWVKRVSISEPSHVGNTLEKAAWYGEKGIWYDALTNLMEVRESQPNNQNIRDICTQFLKSGGVNSEVE
ncbi:MAG: DUF928 domain-containing protein [Microcystaceae cyanobacterium]